MSIPVSPPSGVLDDLQRKTAELQAILRALPDLFFRFDAEGRFLDFSAPSPSQLYASPDEFLGKRARDVLPPELGETLDRVRLEALRTNSLVTHEYELAMGGMLQHYEARYVPFIEGQTIAIVRNISGRLHAERALRASEERLRESLKIEAVGRLAGGVAHNFNNLLMIILCSSASIAQKMGPSHPIAAALEEIRRAGQRAKALTKQLLALSRHQPPQRNVLDLGEILQEMHSMLRRVLGGSIALETSVGPDLWHVYADRSQIEQVILNLVLNARDAMPHGGELHISAKNMARHRGSSQQSVVLSVADRGSGMTADTRERMFEPFFTTKAHGTGLGLFTVQQIARESGGTVVVSSELGMGTRVSLQLPRIDRPREVAPLELAGPLPRGTEVVLVAEDEDAVRTLLAALLSELGYTVLPAATGHEALELLTVGQHTVDLLLTDVVMPGISGWELGARAAELQPRCRVLYMSGQPLEPAHDLTARATVRDLLAKPFTPETLAARIREALERAEARVCSDTGAGISAAPE